MCKKIGKIIVLLVCFFFIFGFIGQCNMGYRDAAIARNGETLKYLGFVGLVSNLMGFALVGTIAYALFRKKGRDRNGGQGFAYGYGKDRN